MTKSWEENEIEKLNKELTERDTKIKQLTTQLQNGNGRISPDSTSADLLLLITEYQNQVAKLEEEHREYLRVIHRLNSEKKKLESITGKIQLDELEEKTERLENERNELQSEVEELKERLEKFESIESKLSTLKGENLELQKEKELLESTVPKLQEKLENFTKIKEEKARLEIKVGSLKDRLKTLNTAMKQLDNLKNNKFDLETDVQGLKSKLERNENELKDSLELIQFQAEKIEVLESIRNQAEDGSKYITSTDTSSIKGKLYFSFIKEEFVKASKKAENISLEFDSLKNLWILTVDPKVPFIKKSKALRIARSLPVLGVRLPNGKLVGNGSEIVIIGE